MIKEGIMGKLKHLRESCHIPVDPIFTAGMNTSLMK